MPTSKNGDVDTTLDSTKESTQDQDPVSATKSTCVAEGTDKKPDASAPTEYIVDGSPSATATTTIATTGATIAPAGDPEVNSSQETPAVTKEPDGAGHYAATTATNPAPQPRTLPCGPGANPQRASGQFETPSATTQSMPPTDEVSHSQQLLEEKKEEKKPHSSRRKSRAGVSQVSPPSSPEKLSPPSSPKKGTTIKVPIAQMVPEKNRLLELYRKWKASPYTQELPFHIAIGISPKTPPYDMQDDREKFGALLDTVIESFKEINRQKGTPQKFAITIITAHGLLGGIQKLGEEQLKNPSSKVTYGEAIQVSKQEGTIWETEYYRPLFANDYSPLSQATLQDLRLDVKFEIVFWDEFEAKLHKEDRDFPNNLLLPKEWYKSDLEYKAAIDATAEEFVMRTCGRLHINQSTISQETLTKFKESSIEYILNEVIQLTLGLIMNNMCALVYPTTDKTKAGVPSAMAATLRKLIEIEKISAKDLWEWCPFVTEQRFLLPKESRIRITEYFRDYAATPHPVTITTQKKSRSGDLQPPLLPQSSPVTIPSPTLSSNTSSRFFGKERSSSAPIIDPQQPHKMLAAAGSGLSRSLPTTTSEKLEAEKLHQEIRELKQALCKQSEALCKQSERSERIEKLLLEQVLTRLPPQSPSSEVANLSGISIFERASATTTTQAKPQTVMQSQQPPILQ